MEAEADAFGLNAARQPDGAAQAALHLAEYRKMQPGAVEEIIFFDRPSGWRPSDSRARPKFYVRRGDVRRPVRTVNITVPRY
jgi:hypothetical protein